MSRDVDELSRLRGWVRGVHAHNETLKEQLMAAHTLIDCLKEDVRIEQARNTLYRNHWLFRFIYRAFFKWRMKHETTD